MKFDIRQKINSFLLKEDGKISKASILKAGILLGAIAFAGKAAHAGDVHSLKGGYNGDCPGIDAAKFTQATTGNDAHTNSDHGNNLNVKPLFGRLVLGHSNCVETHSQHQSNWHDEGGHAQCCTGPSGNWNW